MAEITKGANGAFFGKVGSVVGSSWKKINYIRSLPKRSTKAPSEAQLIQQKKFATVVAFLSPIRILLETGFGQTNGRLSGYNMAVNYNLTNAVNGTYPDFTIDYEKVLISKGSLMSNYGITTAVEAGKLKITWPALTETSVNAYADDVASILVYNSTKSIHMINKGILRSLLTAEIAIPADFIGDELEVYLFFTSRKGKSCPSSYLGNFIAL